MKRSPFAGDAAPDSGNSRPYSLGSAFCVRSKAFRQRERSRPRSPKADAWIEMSGAKSYEPFLHVERAELARLNGDDAARQRELREANRLFLEIGAPIRAQEVAREFGRSEEHTSELQSQSNLVCRLLLE